MTERPSIHREERQEARKDLALLLLDVMKDEASDTERLSTVRSICENLTKPPLDSPSSQ